MTLLNGTTGQRGTLPAADGARDPPRPCLEEPARAGGLHPRQTFPKEWEAFWSFWCDQVQPAVRKALGRDDIWASACPCRSRRSTPTNGFWQFMHAYEADYVTRDGRLVIDDPEIRRRLIKAIDSYTADLPQGLHAARFGHLGRSDSNNEQFLAQTVVMTPNMTLSILNALKRERPGRLLQEHRDDRMADRRRRSSPCPIEALRQSRRGLQGRRARRDRQGVRALPGRRGLARALSRLLRRAHAAADAEAARAAVLARPERPAPHALGHAARDSRRAQLRLCRGLRRLAARAIGRNNVWAKAVHRVAAEGISPEQAVDEAIARIKEILAE